jgi:tetratricopeptide (TPR) repeat protein
MAETDFTDRILSSYTSSDFKKSLVHSLDLLESDTENSFAKQYYVLSLLKLTSDTQSLLDILLSTLDSNPNPDAYMSIGILYLQLNQTTDALQYLLKAKDSHVLHYQGINYHTGIAYLMLNDIDNAEIFFYKAIDFEPNNLKIYQALFSAVRFDSEKLQKFLEFLQQRAERSVDVEFLLFTAKTFVQNSLFTEAINYAKKASEYKPSFDSYYTMAYSYFKLNQIESAVEYIQKAFDMNPDSIDASILMMYITSLLQKFDKYAVRAIDFILNSSDPQTLLFKDTAFELKADSLMQNNDFAQAVDYYTKAIEQFADTDTTPVNLLIKRSLANEKAQNVNDAISDIELVLDSVKQEDSQEIGIKIESIDRLIKLYAAAGDTKKVLELAEVYKQTLNTLET